MMSFAEKERACEIAFGEFGPFWHVYTDGSIMIDFFSNDDEKKEGMIVLAVCAMLFREVELVTFELMNNHVHLIMRGSREGCLDFFDMFKRRLKRRFQRHDRVVDWDRFEAQILEIETLRALRNEIIYVNRNAYVANHNYTPFSYPWGGGWAYFSPVIDLLSVISVREMGARRVRELTHFRDVDEIVRLRFVGDVPYIPSFCRIDIGESLFQNARSYFYALSRNAEAYSQVASRLKDNVFLTDDEMFVVAARSAESDFSTRLRLLTPDQKIQLARKLHFDYNASNAQLRRILNLDLAVLNELFPPIG
jgi:REP element-mobilizing transposase RayT